MFGFTAGAGVLAGAALLLAGVAAAPAGAAVEWSDPKEVSSRNGWQVALSDDGQMAAWIRVGNRPGPGPVHTSKYLSARRGWSKSKQVPGSAEATEVELSGDGDTLLVKSGSGYSIAARKGDGNAWAKPAQVYSVPPPTQTFLNPEAYGGLLSGDGDTFAWVTRTWSWSPWPPRPEARLQSRSRSMGGSWGPAVLIGGFTPYGPGLLPSGSAALSRDGSTAAWLDDSARLVVGSKTPDTGWTAPVVVMQYGDPSGYEDRVRFVQLSANGSRLLWQGGLSQSCDPQCGVGTGVLTSTQTASGWSPVTYVMQNDVSGAVMSPNGRVVAYGQVDSDRLRVRRFVSGSWTSPKTLGPSQPPPEDRRFEPLTQIVVRNKVVAWVEQAGVDSGSKLRVSLLRKGKWGKAVTIAPNAQSPALSSKGDTLAWAGTGAGKIFSVKR